ncbi:hypothetical protein NNO95_03925 [Acinetobacter baumannii]|uniref:hypothetical protein n=1 Tax=Acinetobacter baumannii TaxID=470 RepID=UPI0020CBD910|nr:hypothetical protein [Acinetobacter baumannii]MCQ1053526.1 hypothetical protein [Acinetobacter baumannii]
MNTAALIHFPKPQDEIKEARKSMYSDKFENGYVMSSRLYRKEVWPFLSDAARNVYAELENRINGHNKESDFVSYSQLQGGELEGSRQLSRETVRNGIKELLNLGVITAVATGKRGMKSYQLNDISLLNQFAKRTSSETEPVQESNQKQFGSRTKSSSETEPTIDNKNLLEEEEENTREVSPTPPQNRPLNFIQYHSDDRMHVSLLELTKKYPAQFDFQNQAKTSFPNHTAEQVFAELKKLAQWSIDKSKQTPQGWMNTWLKWMQKVPTAAEVQKDLSRSKTASSPTAEKPKKPRHRYGQGIVGGTTHE